MKADSSPSPKCICNRRRSRRRAADLVRRAPAGCAEARGPHGGRLHVLCHHAGDVLERARHHRRSGRRGGPRGRGFGTSHLLFCCIDETYEKARPGGGAPVEALCDGFPQAGARYAALGTPADIAEKIATFHAAGVRHFNLDFIGDQPMRIEACTASPRKCAAHRLSAAAAFLAARCPSATASASEPPSRTAPAANAPSPPAPPRVPDR